ncbi:hypothetical protein KQ940_22485 [Marinobacterium sp. D7]|uniref:hypothetical protein n=1 Tax=Marinobacterium ramblicola TaxID=2849041 RepID=UPI001C2D0DB1|nr:hypothetical protein [Marinobacterium ramblicola]MBV1790839.1 hypothetical protein [Marinobacterium ramblicola]
MDLTPQHYSFIGICLDIVGALMILSGVFVTKNKAVEIGVPRYASKDPEENLKLPSVANLLSQSKTAVWGTVFLIVGFIFQAIASWPF